MSHFGPWVAHETAEVARTARVLAQSAIRRASIAFFAVLLVMAGAGFLLSTVYLSLTRYLGPERAGLILGAALLVCAAVLFVYARWKRPRQGPANASPDQPAASAVENELTPLAAFVAAFVLARQLRRRQTR